MRARPAWRRRVVSALLLAGALLLALDFVHAWDRGAGPRAYLAFDTYQYIYCNMLYWGRAVMEGGRGLFWNALQHCGQPFFGIFSTATLYPPHWLFLLLNADLALRAVIVLHLVIIAVAGFALLRELGASPVAAAAGAIAFELGNATLNVTAFMTIVAAPYAWMPLAMLCCERILRAPSLRWGIYLGLVLAVALLAGYPQMMFFIYQLIALRTLWELVARRVTQPRLALAVLAFALVLPVLLDAVQVLPAVATASDSVRGANLQSSDMAPAQYTLKLEHLRRVLGSRAQINCPLVLIPAMIASASLIAPRTRRVALFYAVVGLAYFLLAFGEATPLFAVYKRLPLVSLFRVPVRFIWVTGFCVAVLTGLGVDALTRSASERVSARSFAGIALAAATFAVLWAVSIGPLQGLEWILAAVVIGAGSLVVLAPTMRMWAAVALTVALCVNLAWFRTPGQPSDRLLQPLRPLVLPSLLRDGSVLRAESAAFEDVRGRATPQDRLYTVYRQQTPTFGPKTGALFDLPTVMDYEPQPSRRMAEYMVMMRLGRPMNALDDYYITFGGTMPPSFRRRLLDLAAGRFVLVQEDAAGSLAALDPAPLRIAAAGDLTVYENQLALPRAFYVPRVEVVGEPSVLLHRLAEGNDDLTRVALVEGVPPSGFTGIAGNEAAGEVEYMRNDPEHLVLRVRAPQRGFLFLADQYADGWAATIAGEDAPIMRANYVFRALEVPAGESTVEMRYVPPGLLRGAVISFVTVAALLLYAAYRWRRSLRTE